MRSHHAGYLAAVAAAAEASHVVKLADTAALTGQAFTAGACAARHQALADDRPQIGRAHSLSGQSAIIEDPPLSVPDVGVDIAADKLARLAIGVLDQSSRVAPPSAAPPQIAQSVKPPNAEPPPRVKVGGLVKMARLLHRVDPVYPPIARQARISGTVELTGVIGIDGRIRELQVVHGHPFLAKAALEAVRQWTYEPTLLNGAAVEVIAPITVNFLLN